MNSATKINPSLLIATSLAMLLTLAACERLYAHGGGGDIALFSTPDNQVDVGFAILDDDDDVQLFVDRDESVFLSVLLPIGVNPQVPWDFGSPEPGFDADEGELSPEADIAYNLHELWYWDGTGAVHLVPAAGINGGVAPQPQKTFADGGFHSHPFFGVEDPVGTPPSGIYVGKLTVGVEGMIDSDPYYMVSLVDDAINSIVDVDEQIEAAETLGELVRLYAEDPLANPPPIFNGVDYTFYAGAVSFVRNVVAIPEPGTLPLAALGLVGVAVAAARRRSA